MQIDSAEWVFKIETRNLTADPLSSRLFTFLEDSEDGLKLTLERIVGAVCVDGGIISQNVVRIELHRIEKRGLDDPRVTAATERRNRDRLVLDEGEGSGR